MKKIWRETLRAVTPYEAGQSLEVIQKEMGLTSLRRLSANENPLGPSPKVVEALRKEAERAHLYPDGGSTALREAIGRNLNISPEWIMAGNGGDEVISIIARATFEPGDEILMPHPSFEPYSIEARLSGATPVLSPLKGYETDLDDLLKRVTARTKVVFLCTPHNPATTIVRRAPLDRFLSALGDDPPLVVIDEAYRDFCDDPDTPDGVALARRWPRVISLRTFSKIAGLAGLRVGFAVAQPEAIGWLNRVRAPFNVNRFAQVAAVVALGDAEHLERSRALVLTERPRLLAELAAVDEPAGEVRRGRGAPGLQRVQRGEAGVVEHRAAPGLAADQPAQHLVVHGAGVRQSPRPDREPGQLPHRLVRVVQRREDRRQRPV
jgi:histidinol-phosphate aminotransferase